MKLPKTHHPFLSALRDLHSQTTTLIIFNPMQQLKNFKFTARQTQ